MSTAAIKAGQAFVEITARDEKLKRTLLEDGRRMKEFARKAAMIGAAAILAAGAAGIAAASTLEETLNKFNVVFGENAAAMKDWGDTFAQEVGRSQRQVAEFLGNTQDLLIPIGFEQGEAERLSKEITQLAIDVASFNNKADADVLRDFHAALTGGGETVKKYGVVLNVAAIKQKLLESSIDPGTATAAQKAWASYQIILESTTAAQGDAIRSGDSFANQLKRVQGNLEDTAAALGSALLPMASDFLKIINAIIVPTAQWLSDNHELVAVAIKMAAGLGAVVVAVRAVTLATVAYTKAQAVAQAFMGPKGWATLAASAAAAAIAITSVDAALGDVTSTLNDFDGSLEQAAVGFGHSASEAEKAAQAYDRIADSAVTAALGTDKQTEATTALDRARARAAERAAKWDSAQQRFAKNTAEVQKMLDGQKTSAEKLSEKLKTLNSHLAQGDRLNAKYGDKGARLAINEGFNPDEIDKIRDGLIDAATGFRSELARVQQETAKLNGDLTDAEILLAKMAEKGLPAEELAELRGALQGLDKARAADDARKKAAKASEKQKQEREQQQTELKDRAQEIRDALKTPAERMADLQKEMRELVRAGVLDRNSAREYLDQQRKQARDAIDSRRRQQDQSITQAASQDLRSAGGAALLNRLVNRTGSSEKNIEKHTKNTAKHAKTIADKATAQRAKI